MKSCSSMCMQLDISISVNTSSQSLLMCRTQWCEHSAYHMLSSSWAPEALTPPAPHHDPDLRPHVFSTINLCPHLRGYLQPRQLSAGPSASSCRGDESREVLSKQQKSECTKNYFKNLVRTLEFNRTRGLDEKVAIRLRLPGSFPPWWGRRHRSTPRRGRPCSACSSGASRWRERSAAARSASLRDRRRGGPHILIIQELRLPPNKTKKTGFQTPCPKTLWPKSLISITTPITFYHVFL